MPDGRKLGRLDHIFKGLSFIKWAQIIQRELDYIGVDIAVIEKYSKAYEKIVLERLHKYINSEGIKYFIKNLDHIERNARCKFESAKNLMNQTK